MVYALGVDIGGTKIASVIIDHHGQILNRSEVPSNPVDKEKMFQQVVESINLVLTESCIPLSKIDGMGLGIPGKVDRKNGIAVYQNNLPWGGFPVVERLRNYFSFENITIDNDVYMAAFAEWHMSKMYKKETFVYLTVSTGISCSIIHEGSFIRGAGFAGEIGLLPVWSKSLPNVNSSIENAASGPAIQKIAQRNYKNPTMTTKDFFQKYQNGSPLAKTIMEEVVESLVRGIYPIVCLLDPHTIVVGGGVINNHPYLLDLVKESLEKNYLISEQQSVLERIQTAQLKGNSGIVGAGLRGLENSESYILGEGGAINN